MENRQDNISELQHEEEQACCPSDVSPLRESNLSLNGLALWAISSFHPHPILFRLASCQIRSCDDPELCLQNYLALRRRHRHRMRVWKRQLDALEDQHEQLTLGAGVRAALQEQYSV